MLETVRARPVRRMISTDVFEVVGGCPVQCIGDAARIAAPAIGGDGLYRVEEPNYRY